MKFGRKKPEPTRRQRQQSSDTKGLSTSFAYHNRRSDYDQNVGRQVDRPPVKPAQQTVVKWFKASGMGGLLLLIVALGALVSIASVSSTPKVIFPDTKTSALLRDPNEYAVTATKILNESVLNRNKITVNVESVRKGLLAEYPELASASVTLPLVAHKPVIHLEPEQPAIVLATQNGQFIISLSGKALLLSDNAPSSAKLALPVVTDESGLMAKANDQILPATQVAFINTVISQLRAKGIAISSVAIPESTSELDVQVNGQPYFAKFNLQRPNSARQQAGTFIATQNQLKTQNIVPSKYIDVRVDGRAYYQ